jgi:hypothetical protein
LIDAEGHCYFQVPLGKKAWTIGNLNSETVNIEVIGTGKERTYPAGTAGAEKLRSVVRELGRIYSIPLRLGATDGRCNVTRTGIITHWMGGVCSGGHIDIKPFSITRVVADIARPHVSSSDRRDCRRVHAYRLRRKAGKPKTSAGVAAFDHRRARVRSHSVRCVDGRPVVRS